MTSNEPAPIVDDDCEELYPVKSSLLGAFRHSANWKCLILTTLILGCLGAIVWCRLAEVTKTIVNFSHFPITKTFQSSPCDDGYIYIPIAFVITLYLVYLVECWHCSTRIDLKYKMDAAKVYDIINSVKESLPVVWWKAICYHYVRRSRQVTRYRNGDAYTSTQVYYERINSHSASASFVFAHCGVKDISKRLLHLDRYPATKIRFSKGFAFANMEAAAEFEDQRARFFQENERRDDYMEMREGLDLTNVHFKEFLVAFANPDHLPWYMSNLIFWIASFFLVSWPLRLLVCSRTAYVHYQVTKMFGVHYVNSRNNNNNKINDYPALISPSNEWRTNLGSLLPTYSEALLMDSMYPQIDPHRQQQQTTTINNFLSRARSISYLNPSSSSSCGHNSSQNHPTQVHRLSRGGHRHSWTMFTPASNNNNGGAEITDTEGNCYLGLRPSITRLSLHNGHVLYHPLALWETLPSSFSFHRHPIKVARHQLLASSSSSGCLAASSQSVTTSTGHVSSSPPDYEVAIQVSRPLSLATMQLLRRSQTEREIQNVLQRSADADYVTDDHAPGSRRMLADKEETAL